MGPVWEQGVRRRELFAVARDRELLHRFADFIDSLDQFAFILKFQLCFFGARFVRSKKHRTR
jgi:hypothetical protein